MTDFTTHIKTIIRVATLFLCIIIFTNCEDNFNDNKCTRETILAYLAGDNSLSNEIDNKIDALYKGWNPYMGNLLILKDNKDNPYPVLLKAVEKNGKISSDTIKFYKNNINSASSSLLQQVILDMTTISPSEKYGMILFSHGSSWFQANSLFHKDSYNKLNKSITADNSSYMEIEDFASAIPDKTFDFMIFETCYSANIEMMYALRNKTHYSIASSAEIVSPGFINQYQEDLPKLYETNPDLICFAEDFYNGRNKTYNSCTISVIDNTKLDELASLKKEINPNLLQSEISNIQHFERTTSNTHLIFDLGQYLDESTDNEELKAKIESVFSDVVLMEKHTDSFFLDWGQQTFTQINKSTGLTTYIPQKDLFNFNGDYEKLAWSIATK